MNIPNFECFLSEKLGKMEVKQKKKLLVKCCNILSLCRDIIDFGLSLKRQVYVVTHIFIVTT